MNALVSGSAEVDPAAIAISGETDDHLATLSGLTMTDQLLPALDVDDYQHKDGQNYKPDESELLRQVGENSNICHFVP